MYYTVAEVAKLMDLSKVSIYNKLKLKELEQYILKNKGITYVSEEGLSCLKSSLNFKDIAAEEIASG
ncbi:MAG: DNA-binding protein, partial [Peptostreptococcaceae bacterium]